MSRQSVYRIEHETAGTGPFGRSLRDALSAHCHQHPALCHEVDEDCLGFVSGYHVCAVEWRSQLEEWFGPFQAPLLAVGFALIEYEPLRTNVLHSKSGKQVAFPKDAATPRRRLDW